jgi:hypothetical protein
LYAESHLLLLWCACDGCSMADSDKDHCRSMRPGAEDRGGRTSRVLNGRTIGRSGDAVCSLHRSHGDEECRFLS